MEDEEIGEGKEEMFLEMSLLQDHSIRESGMRGFPWEIRVGRTLIMRNIWGFLPGCVLLPSHLIIHGYSGPPRHCTQTGIM